MIQLVKKNYAISICVTMFTIMFIVMAVFWIRKGTFGISNDSISLSCPSNPSGGTQIKCGVYLSSSSKILSVNANYAFDDELEYVSFTDDNSCTEEDNCFSTFVTSQNGFVVINTDGIDKPNKKLIGYITLNVPKVSDKNYSIGLSSIELSDDNYEMIYLDDISSSISVVSGNIGFDDDLIINDTDGLISQIDGNVKVNEFKELVHTDEEVQILSPDDQVMGDDDIITTGSKIRVTINGENKEYVLSVLGDITRTGITEINDVSMLYRYFNGLINLSADQLFAGDIDSDGDIGINEVGMLYRYFNGIISSLKSKSGEE